MHLSKIPYYLRIMISFRYAIPSDAGMLLKTRREAVLNSGGGHYSQKQLEAWAPAVDEAAIEAESKAIDNRDRITIIAEADNNASNNSLNLEIDGSACRRKIIGLCTIGISEGLLKQCYILPEYRGKGIAAELVRKAEEIAGKKGIGMLKLSSSLIALGFYKKLGYTEDERYFYDLGKGLSMECVMMSKELCDRDDCE